ncbi:MAG: glycosyltransferase [Phycisphaeraceae bacterium]|nr:glycosyltransferase [Phycisphaeraceae bacterium]
MATTTPAPVFGGALRAPVRVEVPVHRAAVMAVLMPVYNEGEQAAQVARDVTAFAQTRPQHDFTFVLDGCSDNTEQVILDHLAGYPGGNVHVLALRRNRGKNGAIRAGLRRTNARLVCYLDGDLAYSLDHLDALESALATHDVAIGSRSLVAREEGRPGLLRRILGSTFNTIARAILGIPFRDTQAGLKGFRIDAARRLFAQQRIRNFAFDAELLYLACRDGLSVAEIPARVNPGHAAIGSNVRLVRDSLRMLASLIQVRLDDWRGRYD